MPRVRVMLTRSTDVDLSLEERCALANAMEADAFVSIHLNASHEPVRKGGVTTFVLDTTNNRQALRLAARENGTRVAEVTGIQRPACKTPSADPSRRFADLGRQDSATYPEARPLGSPQARRSRCAAGHVLRLGGRPDAIGVGRGLFCDIRARGARADPSQLSPGTCRRHRLGHRFVPAGPIG